MLKRTIRVSVVNLIGSVNTGFSPVSGKSGVSGVCVCRGFITAAWKADAANQYSNLNLLGRSHDNGSNSLSN